MPPIESAFLLSLAFGFVVSIKLTNIKLGCASMLLVPIATGFYISNWQQQNPEVISSTSGLDVVFGTFWPIVGALAGFALGSYLRINDEDETNRQ